ncbi:MAG: aminoacyl-tRNA hydrolase [Lachnospiraceae bacterium]|nr:aminoacyl-tRNA hydrolase [Lachnospiraceae bacterium]
MFIIAGLGNPGREYVNTRHNVGWSALDVFASKYGIRVEEEKFKALLGKGVVEGQKVILVKPLTFMNLSGEAIRAVCDYYKVDPESELIVLYDDISLPVGQLRIRPKGSAGGHNGIKNIIQHLGSEVFLRIKVGVGEKPSRMDLADYVLGHFSEEDKAAEKEAYEKVSEAVVMLMQDKMEEAMNRFNRKVAPPEEEKTE